MDSAQPPIGVMAKIGNWFINAAKAPERIRIIAEGVALDRDPRPFCRSCGKGRIGNLSRIEGAIASVSRGLCENCGCNFLVMADGKLGQMLDRVTPHDGAPGA